MASFPQASPPTPRAHLCPPPYAPHALPISFVSILPPAHYWVRSTDHSESYLGYDTKMFQHVQCHSPIISFRETEVEWSKAADTLMLWCVIGQQMGEVTHEREWSWWAAPCILGTTQKTAMHRRTTQKTYDRTTIAVTNVAGSTRRAAPPVPLVPPVQPAPSIANIRT